MFKDYQVVLPPEIDAKIMHFVNKCDKEISGLGDAWLDVENKCIRITSAFLLEQECGPAETELDDDSIARALFEAHQDEVQSGNPRQLKFWWHSHVNMDVFWSPTDQATMRKLSEHSWFINIVFNKKNERKAALTYPMVAQACGVETKYFCTDDSLKIVPHQYILSEAEKTAYDEEYEENYTEKRYSGGNVNTPGTQTRPDNIDPMFLVHQDAKMVLFYDEEGRLRIWKNGHLRYMDFWPELISKKEAKKMSDDALESVYWECSGTTTTTNYSLRILENELLKRGLDMEKYKQRTRGGRTTNLVGLM
jgi:hypothetical protein